MRLRRSPAEIRFRLAQEAWNFRGFLFPPQPAAPLDSFTRLFPDPPEPEEVLRSVPAYCETLSSLAGAIANGQMPLLGTNVPFDGTPEQDWRRDLLNSSSAGRPDYFRRIPYLNAAAVGDHKVIWELSRHQHLVLLAQAAHLNSGQKQYPSQKQWLAALECQLASWWRANPFHRGINWASALEVAFRALSWIWILHLVGGRLQETTRRTLLNSLFQHASHLAHNLSIYFAPNTHLMGEAVCLHAIGCMLPQAPHADEWRRLGAHWVERCIQDQVLEDGAHFEQSSYYHLYSIDFFLLHALLNPGVSAWYRQRLQRMCELLAAITDRDGSFPLLGDDDGGRLFHPFGNRRFFPRATLTAASCFFDQPSWRFTPDDYAEIGLWWMGPQPPVPASAVKPRSCGVFGDSGLVAGGDDRLQIVFTAKAFGSGTAGHSHAHALHFVARLDQRDLLLDSGTFTYVGDWDTRNRFRSSAAHNTIRIDSMDQGTPVNPFRWGPGRWEGRLVEAFSEPGRLALTAELTDPEKLFRISRKVTWSSGEPLVCDDTIQGPAGEHLIEQFWQLPADAIWEDQARMVRWPGGATLEVSREGAASLTRGEVSGALYHRMPSQTLRLEIRSRLPLHLVTVLHPAR
ncbi:MAG: alginate lyase family protein [Bryobacterales bacterium]|nr:alginate lyase family protein [Bryobacterales bacterium]